MKFSFGPCCQFSWDLGEALKSYHQLTQSSIFMSSVQCFFFFTFSKLDLGTIWNDITLFLVAIHCDGHILISFVFPHFTSFHSVFHPFHGLMNSTNWPASSIWVFIAQLGEHCSVNAEAKGSNPVEAPKNLFFGLFSQLRKLRFTAMVTYSFHSLFLVFGVSMAIIFHKHLSFSSKFYFIISFNFVFSIPKA